MKISDMDIEELGGVNLLRVAMLEASSRIMAGAFADKTATDFDTSQKFAKWCVTTTRELMLEIDKSIEEIKNEQA